MKNLIGFLLLMIFSSCSQFKIELDKGVGGSLEAHCHIFDLNGNIIRRYPGYLCSYDDSGELLLLNILSDNFSLIKYDKFMQKQWEIEGHFHHQINQAENGDYLLLGSDFIPLEKVPNGILRADTLLRVSKQGKILSKAKTYDQLKKFYTDEGYEIPLDPFKWDDSYKRIPGKTYYESSHFNSIHEVKFDNLKIKKLGIEKGDILANNSFCKCTILLTHDLSRVKKIFNFFEYSILHDVQIMEDGRFLLYVNGKAAKDFSIIKESEIVLYDYEAKNIEILFKGFFAIYSGGVQSINNGIYLISDFQDYPKARFVKDERILKEINFAKYFESIQQVRLLDLRKFLEKNLGL